MGGWDSCCVAGWLLPFVFSLPIPIGVGRVAGGSGCFCLHIGAAYSLTCTRILRFQTLQGSLPDVECETDVYIVIFFLLERCRHLNYESLSWWELR